HSPHRRSSDLADTSPDARNTVCTARSSCSQSCRLSATALNASVARARNARSCAARASSCCERDTARVAATPRSSASAAQDHAGRPVPQFTVPACNSRRDASESADSPKRILMTTVEWSTLYRDHLTTVRSRADTALERAGLDHLVVPSGTLHYQVFDDRDYPYAVNPQFKAWLPLTRNPGSWLVHTPGQRPRLLYLQPRDYWHVVPRAPSGHWVPEFDIVVIRTPEEALQHLPGDPARCAILGEPQSALGGYVPGNPPAVVDYLEYHRAFKTPYEVA